MSEKIKAKPFNLDNLNKYTQERDEDFLNVGYDLSKNKDHAVLTVTRIDKDVMRVLSTFYNEDARFIYDLLRGKYLSVKDGICHSKK